MSPGQRKPISEVAGDIMRQGSELAQKEAELARTELSEKISQLKAAIAKIIAGAVLLIVSSGILLSALVSGVARLLVGVFGDDATTGREVVGIDGLAAGQVELVTAVGRNVDAALDAARTLPTYESLAALIVGLLFAVVGAVFLRSGLTNLDPSNLMPERTLRQVRNDAEMARDRV
jgi:hypothetical protein